MSFEMKLISFVTDANSMGMKLINKQDGHYPSRVEKIDFLRPDILLGNEGLIVPLYGGLDDQLVSTNRTIHAYASVSDLSSGELKKLNELGTFIYQPHGKNTVLCIPLNIDDPTFALAEVQSMNLKCVPFEIDKSSLSILPMYADLRQTEGMSIEDINNSLRANFGRHTEAFFDIPVIERKVEHYQDRNYTPPKLTM
jgi:hypothetical protein